MLNIIMDYRMAPPLSALSLALCHEALEGGGNHKTETIISQKETSPMLEKWCHYLIPSAENHNNG